MAHKIFSETYYFSSDILKYFVDRDNEKLADDFESFATNDRLSHRDMVRFMNRWYTDSSVLTKGQPLFAATPAIPAAGLLGDEGE